LLFNKLITFYQLSQVFFNEIQLYGMFVSAAFRRLNKKGSQKLNSINPALTQLNKEHVLEV